MTFLAFKEQADGPAQADLKPFPRLMTWVLWPLAVLAVGDGFLNFPGGPGKDFLARFMAVVPGSRPDLGASTALEWTMGLGSGAIILAMMALAYYLYGRPGKAWAWPGGEGVLAWGFYLDYFYQQVLVKPYQALARIFWQDVDEAGLDRSFGGLAAGLLALSGGLGRWTTGRLSTYLAMLFLGLTLLVSALAVSWYLW
ncbi:MAG: hypothetical protein PHU44_19585, partial [Syntrophales bacterium]|nr:hypothetical protein [Syntrophales bacterium]